jgi:hypothetical protein
MGETGRALVSIVGSIIGLSILSVVLSQRAQTSSVIQAGASGLSSILSAATAPVTGSSSGSSSGLLSGLGGIGNFASTFASEPFSTAGY